MDKKAAKTKPKIDPVPALAVAAPAPWERKDWQLVGVVVGIALIARLVYFLLVRQAPWFAFPMVDSLDYHNWILSILSGDFLGHGPYVHGGPLYPFFAALIYALSGSSMVAVLAVQLVLGAFACGLLYQLGRSVFSRWTGLAAGLINAVYGIAIFHEGSLLTVTLIHVLNILLLLAAYWAIRQKNPWAWIVPGILTGLSAIARPTGLPFPAVLLVWVALVQTWDWRKRLLPAVLALGLGTGAMLLPVTLRNAVVLHEFMLTIGHGGLNFYLGNSKRATHYFKPFGSLGNVSEHMVADFKEQAENVLGRPLTYSQSSRFWFQQAWREIKEDPERWQLLIWQKLAMFLNHYEYTTSLNYYAVREITPFLRWPWLSLGVVAPLGLLGMLLAARQWRKLLPLYGFLGLYLAANVMIFVTSEYRFAAMPVVFLFAGWAAEELVRRIRTAPKQLILPLLLLGLFAVAVNLDVLGREGRDYHMAVAHSNYGNLFGRLGLPEEASRQYRQSLTYLTMQPNYRPGINKKLGLALIDQGKFEEAASALADAYAESPDDPAICDVYAGVLTKLKRYPEAIVLRQKVVAATPDNPEAYSNMAVTYLWAGQDKLAHQALVTAVSLNPELEPSLAYQRDQILKLRSQEKSKP